MPNMLAGWLNGKNREDGLIIAGMQLPLDTNVVNVTHNRKDTVYVGER